MEELVAGQC
jgi:DNA-binding response OmpR family regulator